MINWKEERNLSLLADFYEFTMANGYLKEKVHEHITYFDLYFRSVPDNGGFAIFAGLEQFVDYIKNLHFEEDDIEKRADDINGRKEEN